MGKSRDRARAAAFGLLLVASLGLADGVSAAASEELPPPAPIDATTSVGPAVGPVASDGDSVWAGYAGGVARVDAATGEVVQRVNVGVNGGVAVGADEVWISSYTHGI